MFKLSLPRTILKQGIKRFSQTRHQYYRDAKSWYSHILLDKVAQLQRSYRIIVALFISLCISLITLAVLMPLKHIEGYVVSVNKLTGEVTRLTPLNAAHYQPSWPLIRAQINQYLHDREGYNFIDLKRQYYNVIAHSEPDVASRYTQQLVTSNPKSPVTRYKRNNYIIVKVRSINPLNKFKQAVIIKFTTQRYNTQDSRLLTSQSFNAILRYRFDFKHTNLTLNPLGFKVTYYDKQRLT